MKKKDLFYAISEIDEDLISEAMEEVKVAAKNQRSRKILFSSLSAAAIFALGIGFSAYGENFTLKPTVVVTTEKSTEETQKAEKEVTASKAETKLTEATTAKPKETEVQPITTAVPHRNETTVTSAPKETTEKSTEKPTEESTKPSVPSGTASYNFEYWVNAPDVVWGEDAVKGSAGSELIPLGTIKITDSLKKLMADGDDSTVYAVQVGFSSCAEKEFENWEFDGTTFAKLKKGYNKAEMTDEEIANYKTKVWEMKYAFCNQKIDSFKDTFSKAGLKIYVLERNITDCFFYVFGTKKQIEGINPKGTEAFVLYAADQMK